VKGDLYLRGGGDPALVTADLYELASDLHARGIERITGRVVVDASRFDRDELPPGYDQKDEFASYRAPTGAATVNFNTFVVRVQPGPGAEAPAHAASNPDVPSVQIVNRVRTTAGSRRRVFVRPEPTSDGTVRVVLSGEIGADAGAAQYRYPVADPSRYAGEVFTVVLRQRGIKVGRRDVAKGTIPDDARLLATHFSPTLGDLARSVNKLSNNFMAEQILKTLSEEDVATYPSAIARVRNWLEDRKLADTGLRYGNGSGLYDTNRVTPTMMTELLALAYRDFRISSDFLASLAVMGADGTTRSRLADSPARRWIRAKTGTLNEVSALSGYAGAHGRAPIAFSILVNDLEPGELGRTRRIQDGIAEALAAEAARLATPTQ
jgi:D-alanyl-D-alanine carboxypeptidase/D-alanyl-D-alanine-endopeptidase (penicillin-binding protein 4)